MARFTRDMVEGGSSPIRDISRFLSIVRICSSRITLSLASPNAEFDMRRQLCLVYPACDRRRDHRGGIFVPRVVLHHKNGAHAALLAPHHGREVGIVKFSSFNVHITPL